MPAPERVTPPSIGRGGLLPLLERLVSIDSVNPGLGGPGEAEIAAFVAEWAREAGLEVELDEAAPGRPNVIATARGSGGGETLLLNAHLDTVGLRRRWPTRSCRGCRRGGCTAAAPTT